MTDSALSSNNSSKPRLELIVFDLGGVLVRLRGSWEAAFEAANLPAPPGLQNAEITGQIRSLVHAEEQGQMEERGFFRQVSSLLDVAEADLELVSSLYLVEAYPGVTDLLTALQSVTARTACLSNTNAPHWKQMTTGDGHARLPLELLDFRFASQLLGHRKPDPPIYQSVVNQTGVAPDRIVFFDDKGENIEAAIGAGWHAHRIDPQGDPIGQCREHLAGYDLS